MASLNIILISISILVILMWVGLFYLASRTKGRIREIFKELESQKREIFKELESQKSLVFQLHDKLDYIITDLETRIKETEQRGNSLEEGIGRLKVYVNGLIDWISDNLLRPNDFYLIAKNQNYMGL